MKISTRNQGFTNKLYFLNLKLTWSYVFACVILTAFSGRLEIDVSPLLEGFPYIFAELGIHTGFVVWKAKVENCRKNKDVNRLADLEGE